MTLLTLACDSPHPDTLEVETGPGSVFLKVISDSEDMAQSVLLNEREKVEQLHKALADWLANPHNGAPL